MSDAISQPALRDEFDRRDTAKDRVRRALEAAGDRGLTNVVLNDICYRYGARLHELKKEGLRIAKSSVGKGVYSYRIDVSEPARPDERAMAEPMAVGLFEQALACARGDTGKNTDF